MQIYEKSETATVYQSPEWLHVLENLKGELLYLEVDENSIIPFICKGKGRLRRCYSLSFDTYGGPVTSGNTNVPFDEVVEMLKIPSIRMVDFSSKIVDHSNTAVPIHAHIVDLTGGTEDVAKAYAQKNRAAIRQSKRRGLRIEKMDDPNLLHEFYTLHARCAWRHGTIPHPLTLFREIFNTMAAKNMASFYFAHHGNKAVACTLILRDKKTAYAWLIGYRKESLQLRPANALIDRAIQDEIDLGGEAFNLGTSPSDHIGIVKFKESFGAKPHPYRIFFRAGLSYNMMRKLKSTALRIGRKEPIVGNSNGANE